ncbi:hypothetical protein Tel_06600 [Candidatus Tenderia electrophaga]|uniref:Farnesyl-diphosphate farnesyltransferase n=1 Tax=Candidatus Tenderia electrophaga TaxID=1748243 RepID=A0A0S2THZ6_9GAMM|nr:hypothetical protein Tel_06600 [Candidatus Tenderia electrophaga]
MHRRERKRLLRDILKGVSRSFYLTLRVLPGPLREPIGLAYLLARAADTLADTPVVPPNRRLQYLQCFKTYIASPGAAGGCDEIQFALRNRLANRDEARLLESLPQLFTLFAAQPAADRERMRQVVTTLTDGMVFDLNTFPAEESGAIKALQREDELDRYTYLVAGCVGQFWTEMSMVHVAALKHWDQDALVEKGVRFGKALQLTNILRDLPRDLRIGRCYLPRQWLRQYDLSVAQLLEPNNSAHAKPLLEHGITLALQHFAAAEAYVLAIPRRCVRLRLAALWPLMIGLETLARLASSDHCLDADISIKVERRRVYAIMLRSALLVLSNTALRRWLVAARGAAHARRQSG